MLRNCWKELGWSATTQVSESITEVELTRSETLNRTIGTYKLPGEKLPGTQQWWNTETVNRRHYNLHCPSLTIGTLLSNSNAVITAHIVQFHKMQTQFNAKTQCSLIQCNAILFVTLVVVVRHIRWDAQKHQQHSRRCFLISAIICWSFFFQINWLIFWNERLDRHVCDKNQYTRWV